MSERSCPSCHEPVAAHQTLCPVCRTPVPSEAGPVATDSTAFRFSAPPPRPTAAEAPPASAASEATAAFAAPPDAPAPTWSPEPAPAAPTERAPAWSPEPSPAAPAEPAPTWSPEPTAPAKPDAPAEPAGPFVVGPSTAGQIAAPEPTAPTGEATTTFRGTDAPAWSPPADTTSVAPAPVPTGPVPADPASAPASAGTLGTPGAAVLDERGNLPGGVIGLVAAALVTIGVFLPWIGVEGRDVSGWAASGDAKILLGIAGIATVVAALLIGGARSLVLRLALVGLGVAAVGLGAFEVVSANGIEDFDVSVGTGLFVVLAGGLALAASGVVTRHKRFR